MNYLLTYQQYVCQTMTERHVVYQATNDISAKKLAKKIWKKIGGGEKGLSGRSPYELSCIDTEEEVKV